MEVVLHHSIYFQELYSRCQIPRGARFPPSTVQDSSWIEEILKPNLASHIPFFEKA